VTEKEIFKGILNAKNNQNNTLFFERNIVDIEQHLGQNVSLIKKFIELDAENEVDPEVKTLLDNLKYKKIPSALLSDNIFKFDVKWSTEAGISLETHKEYLKEFGEVFYDQVKLLIDRNQKEKTCFENMTPADIECFQEVLDHAYFCNKTAEKFQGRIDILNQVKDYILAENSSPLLIYGDSGCGKTAIMAKVTSEVKIGFIMKILNKLRLNRYYPTVLRKTP
jgi:hypothetical protein